MSKIRRIVGLDWRQIAIEAFDLNGRQLPGTALRQGGCTDVPREDVWIAMHAKRSFFFQIDGVVPSARRKLNDTASDAIGNVYACKACTPRIEKTDDIAVGDAARRGIGRMHVSDLSPPMLRARTVPAEIKLVCRRVEGWLATRISGADGLGAVTGASQVG
jgi:hypothetical protein